MNYENLPLEPRAVRSDQVNKEYYNHIFDCISQICSITSPKGEKNNIEDDIEQSNILSILGGRGSGKTSALLSIKKIIRDFHVINERDEPKLFTEYRKLFKSIYVLEKPIDPSVVIDSDNILRLVLSLLFDNYIERNSKQLKENYQAMIEQFIQLNKTINRLTKPELENDSLEDLLSSKEIFNLKASIRRLIADFLSSMSENRTYKHLMIMIDDVDLNTKSCFEMLEQLRKYLSQDNVIIILSGNYDDFERAIRNEYCSSYSSQYTSQENLKELRNQIVNNAEHYLIKVLPKLYRINANENASLIQENLQENILQKLEKIGLYIERNNQTMRRIGEYIYGNSLREYIQFNNSIGYQKNEDKDEGEEKKDEGKSDEEKEKEKIYKAVIRSLCPGVDNLQNVTKYDFDQFRLEDILFTETQNTKVRFAKLITLIKKYENNGEIIYQHLRVKQNIFCYNISAFEQCISKYSFNNTETSNQQEVYACPSIYLWDIFNDVTDQIRNVFLYIQSIDCMNAFKKRLISKDDYATALYQLFESYHLIEEAKFIRYMVQNLSTSDLSGITVVLKKYLTSEEKEKVYSYLNGLMAKKDTTKSTTIIKRLQIIGGLHGKSDFYTIFHEADEINLISKLDSFKTINQEYYSTLKKIIDVLKEWYSTNA